MTKNEQKEKQLLAGKVLKSKVGIALAADLLGCEYNTTFSYLTGRHRAPDRVLELMVQLAAELAEGVEA